jgi:NAD(P)-dependent dehydrogenase (short-subunit alcohol dehydrogenase family)
MQVSGQVALVTGGASGLGRATAERLHALGCSVVLADLASSDGEAVAKALGEGAAFAPCDVTDEQEVSAALDVAQDLGELRVAVNCAGIANGMRVVGRNGPFPLDAFARIVTVNLVGTFNVIRLAAQRMAATPVLDGERGVIVNTASVAAFDGQIGQTSYAASKAAVHGITLVAARDLASRLIRVNTIAPGVFDTPMLGRLREDIRSGLEASVPHPKRLGTPDDYAELAIAILRNPYLNGETIRLDGAIRMGPR